MIVRRKLYPSTSPGLFMSVKKLNWLIIVVVVKRKSTKSSAAVQTIRECLRIERCEKGSIEKMRADWKV